MAMQTRRARFCGCGMAVRLIADTLISCLILYEIKINE